MGLFDVALPLVSTVVGLVRDNKDGLAKAVGVDPDTIGKVGDALQDYLTRDARALKAVMDEIDRARQYDVQTSAGAPPVVLLLKGLVRPIVTFTAFIWYVFARVDGIALTDADYALVGGIVAFWFGFRSFEATGRAAGKL
jgi:hypothetical protein